MTQAICELYSQAIKTAIFVKEVIQIQDYSLQCVKK
jgi:hypothetical protein